METSTEQQPKKTRQRKAPSPNSIILSPRQLCSEYTFSRTTLWRLMKDGRFVAPIQLSERRIGFLRADVEAWLKGLKKAGG